MKYKLSLKQMEKLDRCPYLTDRERKVFELFYKRGLTRAEVGRELYVSVPTIREILKNIRAKLTELVL